MKTKMGIRWAGSILLVLLVACGQDPAQEPVTAVDSTEGSGKTDAVGGADTRLDQALQQALVLLAKKAEGGGEAQTARLARATHQRLRAGDVQVLSLQALTADDYQRVRREFQLSHPDAYTFPEDHEAFVAGSAETEFVLSRYDGWMWAERVYLDVGSLGSSAAEELASTLVHETNHVLNRSEENYYVYVAGADRDCSILDLAARLVVDPAKALREEYRAFYAEYVFSDRFSREINEQAGLSGAFRAAEKRIRSTLAAHVRDLYGIAPRVGLRADVSEDHLIPTPENWRATRAAAAERDPLYVCE